MLLSQKEISELFGVTAQNICIHLNGEMPLYETRTFMEGKRQVSRKLKVYEASSIYKVAVKSKRIDVYHKFCADTGIVACDFLVSRKEQEFSAMLYKFINGRFSIIEQKAFTSYRVDFFIPERSIVIEYDEIRHNRGRVASADRIRQSFIEKEFQVRFVRVKEGAELGGLFDIAVALV